MDILKKAAMAYKDLLNKEYVLVVGKNNKSRSFILQVTPYEFKHICGLHKLKDLPDIRRSSSKSLFYKILNDKITNDDIKKSLKYSDIEERIKNIAHLQEYLDKFDVIYDWNRDDSPFSDIDADLMIPTKSAELNDHESYIFLKNSERTTTLQLSDYIVEPTKFDKLETVIVDKKDYRQGQVRPPTLLYKEKIELSDDSKSVLSRNILFRRESFSLDNNLLMNVADKVTDDLKAPAAEFKKKMSNFSLFPEHNRNELYSNLPPLYNSQFQGSEIVLRMTNRQPSLNEIIKNITTQLSEIAQKISDFLSTPLQLYSQEQPPTRPYSARKKDQP